MSEISSRSGSAFLWLGWTCPGDPHSADWPVRRLTGCRNVIFNACGTSSGPATTHAGLSQYEPFNAREFHGD